MYKPSLSTRNQILTKKYEIFRRKKFEVQDLDFIISYYRRHLAPRIAIERTSLMSIQAYSDGTLPDYFINLHRKASMTEEEIEQEKKQLKKLYMNNCITEENEDYYTEKEEQ